VTQRAPADVVIEVLPNDDASLDEYVRALLELDDRIHEATIDDARRWDETVSGQHRLAARVDGAIVAMATISRTPHDDSTRKLLTWLVVAPEHRQRGIGSLLFTRLRDWATRTLPAPELTVAIPEDDGAALAWWQRRGLQIEDRYVVTQLDIPSVPPVIGDSDGIDVMSLAERPELARAAHETYSIAFADMPGTMKPSPWDEWIEMINSGRRDPGSVLLAIEADAVVGICTTQHAKSSSFARTGFTGVLPAARGRGIATLLKTHQIIWCRRVGVTTLETVNHDDNSAMQLVNERAGFQHRPAQLVLVGEPTDPPPRA
jgi:GNAT superfamily N-acetyltransferase